MQPSLGSRGYAQVRERAPDAYARDPPVVTAGGPPVGVTPTTEELARLCTTAGHAPQRSVLLVSARTCRCGEYTWTPELTTVVKERKRSLEELNGTFLGCVYCLHLGRDHAVMTHAACWEFASCQLDGCPCLGFEV